jgi:hypothetical protein
MAIDIGHATLSMATAGAAATEHRRQVHGHLEEGPRPLAYLSRHVELKSAGIRMSASKGNLESA